jgi:hypothetical protein
MDEEEKSLVIKIALLSCAVGIAGALIGGYFTFYGSYWAWNQQQEVANQQKIAEQKNIATALYFGVCSTEDKLLSDQKDALKAMNNNTSKLEDPGFIYYTNTRYNNAVRILDIFGKEISELDEITSAELYDFYENVIEIDDLMQTVYKISVEAQNGAQPLPADTVIAHTYTKGLFEIKIPDSIQEAETIKQRLREKYNVTLRTTPSNKRVDTSIYMLWNHTNNSRVYSINYS